MTEGQPESQGPLPPRGPGGFYPPGPGQYPQAGGQWYEGGDPERAALRERASKIGLEALVLLIFTPYAPFLLVRALRLRKALHRVGEQVPASTTVALVFGALGTAYLAVVLIVVVTVILVVSLRSPEVWVANGRETPVVLTIDGRESGHVGYGQPRRFELEPGPHTFCVTRGPGEAEVCAGRELGRREKLLWNPSREARFAEVVVYYGERMTEPDVRFLPRDEWHFLGDVDFIFEDPPEEIYTDQAEESRTTIIQAASSPVLLLVDNGLDQLAELEVDGATRVVGQPGHVTPASVDEGRRHVVLRVGGAPVLDREIDLGDFSTYVLDCSGGRSAYVTRTLTGSRAFVDESPVTPAALHDVSRFEEALGFRTARAEVLAPPVAQHQVFEHAGTGQ